MIINTYRRFAYYIPKQPIIFPNDRKKLLYSYEGYFEDKKYMKYFLGFSTTISLFWGIEFMLTKKIANAFFFPFKAALVLSIYPLAFISQNRKSVLKMFLDADGEHAEVMLGGLTNYTNFRFKISESSWSKNEEKFVLKVGTQKMFLDQDGKIHDLELFYAVARSLMIEKDSISVKSE